MIIYPKAKINLGLRIIEKRDDGFHNLESLFVSTPECTDILEIVESDKLSFSLYGATLDCEPGTNICEKAFKLLAKDFDIPGAEIHLYKKIPTGAGLGGGSSNGACTLILLNRLYKLGLDTIALHHYASLLGSDCPYFILAHEDSSNAYSPVIVTGKGDILERYPLDMLNDFKIKIVSPGIFISTADAYAGIVLPKPLAQAHQGASQSKELAKQLKEILQLPPQEWKRELVNDFETHIFKKYPQLQLQKELLYEQGAIYASMTGSGSSLFGLFK
ncbi:MAG: 4-(cytidine 5'-diphospho)-2-C-methyl-D-erythritol kinase [Bacteroidales bacterium]